SVALLEGVKDFRQCVAVDSTAGIFDFNLKLAAAIISASNRELAAVGRKFDGILDQVPKDLLKSRRVRAEMNLARAQLSPKVEFLLCDFRLTDFQRISQQGMSIDNLKAQLHFALT